MTGVNKGPIRIQVQHNLFEFIRVSNHLIPGHKYVKGAPKRRFVLSKAIVTSQELTMITLPPWRVGSVKLFLFEMLNLNVMSLYYSALQPKLIDLDLIELIEWFIQQFMNIV